jgi:Arc/MetJ-type ribon-helix-helix transcriptional regulator
MKTLSVEIPEQLGQRLDVFVQSGYAPNAQQTMIEALRRFLDSHEPALIEQQVLADVAWGLRGSDC